MNSLEINYFLADNYEKQGLGKLAGFPSPLNNTNLYKRSVCLRKILFFSTKKIHRQLLSKINKNRLLTVNNSNFEWTYSSFKLLTSQLMKNDHCLLDVEFPKEDKTVETTGNKGTTTVELDNVLDFFQGHSTPTRQKRNNNGQLARDLIKKYRLTRENIKHSEDFKNFPRTIKKAIYYQFSKEEKADTKEKSKARPKKKKGSQPLSFHVASLLMIPVFSSEILILNFSYEYYDFPLVFAILAAVTVELFFMITSGSPKAIIRFLRVPIYIFSIFTVCYSTYQNDHKIRDFSARSMDQINFLKQELEENKNRVSLLKTQLKGVFKDMEVYRANEMVTKGRRELASEKKDLNTQIKSTNDVIRSLREKIALEENKNINRSAFSKENLGLVEVKTWAIMVFFMIIQFLSSLCTQLFCESYRYKFKKKKRNKNKKMEAFNGIGCTKIAIH